MLILQATRLNDNPMHSPQESFYIGNEVPPDSEEAKQLLLGPNRWPPEAALPGFKATVTAYIDALRALAKRLERLIAAAFDLPPDFFAPWFEPSLNVMAMIHYHAVVSQPDEGLLGAGAHTGAPSRVATPYCIVQTALGLCDVPICTGGGTAGRDRRALLPGAAVRCCCRWPLVAVA